MRTWARGTLLTASFVALGVSVVPATAFADATSGDAGVLSGNQADISGQVPINVCGNAIATAGDAAAGCSSGSVVANAARGGRKAPHKGRAAAAQGGLTTSGKNGVTSGDQVKAPLSAPAEVCGNAVGNGRAECAGGAAVHGGGGSGTRTTGGDLAVLGGNQVEAPGRAPVSVCGNATAIAGNAAATCDGPALVAAPRRSGARAAGPAARMAGTPAPGGPASAIAAAPKGTDLVNGLPLVGDLPVGTLTPHDGPMGKEIPSTDGRPASENRSGTRGRPAGGDLPDLDLPGLDRRASGGSPSPGLGPDDLPAVAKAPALERKAVSTARPPSGGDLPLVKGLPKGTKAPVAGRVPAGNRRSTVGFPVGSEGLPLVGGLYEFNGIAAAQGLVKPDGSSTVNAIAEGKAVPSKAGLPGGNAAGSRRAAPGGGRAGAEQPVVKKLSKVKKVPIVGGVPMANRRVAGGDLVDGLPASRLVGNITDGGKGLPVVGGVPGTGQRVAGGGKGLPVGKGVSVGKGRLPVAQAVPGNGRASGDGGKEREDQGSDGPLIGGLTGENGFGRPEAREIRTEGIRTEGIRAEGMRTVAATEGTGDGGAGVAGVAAVIAGLAGKLALTRRVRPRRR